MQICGLQPVCGLLHMHCESAVLYSWQQTLTLRKISISSEMLQKVQQEWQLLNVLVIGWVRAGVSWWCFFKCVISEGCIHCMGKWFLCSPKRPDLLPPSCSMGMELFALWQSGQGVTLTTYLCLVWTGWLSWCSEWLRAGRSGIESRWGWDFPPIQTCPGAHPASCKMGTGSLSQG